jgi:hypothetical protein
VSWTRRVLEIAAGLDEPDLARLRAAVPEILARARAERVPESTWDALLPVGRRWLPGLAVAAASLALAAFLLQPSASEGWETSLVAEDAVSEALVGTELP